MRRRINLRENVQKNLLTINIMGVIVHLSPEKTHYAAINSNAVMSRKEVTQESTRDEEGNVFFNDLVQFYVTGHLFIYEDQQFYQMGRTDKAISQVEVRGRFEEPPANIYEAVYTLYKNTVASYTDDY